MTAVEWLVDELRKLAHDKSHHLGIGDIRISQGHLDELEDQAKEMEKQQKGFSDIEVELIANEIVNWTIDNIGNPNPQSGKKFDEIMSKFKNK
jgi:hypothetical protein